MNNFRQDVADAPYAGQPSLLDALTGDLTAMDYTVDGVESFLGADAHAALGRDQPVPAQLACAAGLRGGEQAPIAAAALLWLLGGALDSATLRRAFPRTGAAGLEALRLIEAAPSKQAPDKQAPDERAPRQWRASADLRPYASDVGGGLWVASDVGAAHRPGVLRRDHVLGIGGASLTLAQFTVRAPLERALDLGTGCGIQAFHLLAHARHVTATDISVRALAFTRFNLLLNAATLGIDRTDPGARVSLRQGNLLEPVRGETFDLIVSNPPFVITPRTPEDTAGSIYSYRDAGLTGDAVVMGLLRDLPGFLVPGGAAQLLANWEVRGSAAWTERLRGVLDAPSAPAGAIDAWIIQRELLPPMEYAETWLRDASGQRDPAAHASDYAAYLDDFSARQVTGIGFGLVWLRRSAPNEAGVQAAGGLRCFEQLTHEVEQPLAPHVARAVERRDWLAGHQIYTQRLTVASDVTEERHQRPGAEHPGVILLRQGAGFRRTTLLSTELAGLVSTCDGELSVGQIASALAGLLGREDPAFQQKLLRETAALVEDGFLIPAT